MNLFKSIKNVVNKSLALINPSGANTAYTNEYGVDPTNPRRNVQGRGIQIYNMSQLMGISGKDKKGEYLSTRSEQPIFYLTLNERNEIFRLCSPVFGVVSSRMNRISSLPFHVKPIKDIEDQIAEDLKSKRDLFNEYGDMMSMTDLYVRSSIYNELKTHLAELKPDLSNFDSSLLRWKKKLNRQQREKTEEIEHWLSEPNTGTSWSEFVSKWVYDRHIHGAGVIYKQYDNNRLTNFDCLVGGTVFRVKNPFFSSMEAYIQIVQGFESQIFFSDEISYSQYLSTSVRAFGMIPLEALINKITESLLFDNKMANEADGTRPPDKAVIVTNANNPFGDFDKGESGIPIDKAEQKRIEEKLNEPILNGIVTFSGNSATVVDLTRADTLSARIERQKDIREEVALVYNMSNMEVNLTGSGDVSGRSTSESQAEIEAGKGVAPHVKALEEKVSRDLITVRYGYGWMLEIEKQKNEKEERELDVIKLQTGELTQNELREKYNKSVFVGEEYDKPSGGGGVQPGQDQFNPVYNRMVE